MPCVSVRTIRHQRKMPGGAENATGHHRAPGCYCVPCASLLGGEDVLELLG
jgi:hypothetical protein